MPGDAMELEIEHNIVKIDSSPLPVMPETVPSWSTHTEAVERIVMMRGEGMV